MPFMPQPQQRQNPMRIVQEILMMKIQQNQERAKREEIYKQAEKERKENFKNQKALLEYQKILKGTMTPAEKALYDLKTKKLTVENTLIEANIKKANQEIEAQEAENERKAVSWKKIQGGIGTPEDYKAVDMYVAPLKPSAQTLKNQQQEQTLKGIQSFFEKNIPVWRQEINKERGGGFWGKGTTKAGMSPYLLPPEKQIVNEILMKVRASNLPGVEKIDLNGLITSVKERLEKMPDYSYGGATVKGGSRQPETQYEVEQRKRQQYLGQGG